MQPIRLLVARYGALASKSSVARESVAKAVLEATGVRVASSEVDLGDGEVRLKVSGSRRAALFLKKEAAERAAASALGGKETRVR